MKTPSDLKPVSRALDKFEELISSMETKKNTPLPAEKALSQMWGLSASSINRAAHKLIASGKLRRTGYKLYAVAQEKGNIAGARIHVITHKADRLPGIVEEGARKGVELKECFFVGRDAIRRHLQKAMNDEADAVVLDLGDAGWEWDQEVAEMERLNIPCVVAQEAPQGLSMVAEDWRKATALLVETLMNNGHRNIVCVGSLRRKMRSRAVCTAFEETCLRLGLHESALQQFMLSSHTRQGVRKGLQKLRQQYAKASAVIWFDVDHLRNVLLAFHDERLAIPHDLSLAAVGDCLDARANHPPITSASFDQSARTYITLETICRLLSSARHWGRILQPVRVKLEPNLRHGGSVLQLGNASPNNVPALPPMPNVWPGKKSDRIKAVEESWQSSHTLAREARPTDFHQLDLSGTVNRSLHRPHGWLGHLPLKHLSAGRKRIHGVDFDLIDERNNMGRAVLVMQSSRGNKNYGRSALPSRVCINVNRKVRAVYFLHGCGFVAEPSPFAWYDFELDEGATRSTPLVPLGIAPKDAPEGQDANIQDWWADFAQFDAEHVRHLVLAENGDPYEYERYLYSYEWVNPEPDKTLKNIIVRSDPQEAATLGLLAITVLE